jgi:hypothetical protein
MSGQADFLEVWANNDATVTAGRRVAFPNSLFQGIPGILELAQKCSSIIREIFRFQALNVKWPYVRTVHGFGQGTDFPRLNRNGAIHPPRDEAEGRMREGDHPQDECQIPGMNHWARHEDKGACFHYLHACSRL